MVRASRKRRASKASVRRVGFVVGWQQWVVWALAGGALSFGLAAVFFALVYWFNGMRGDR